MTVQMYINFKYTQTDEVVVAETLCATSLQFHKKSIKKRNVSSEIFSIETSRVYNAKPHGISENNPKVVPCTLAQSPNIPNPPNY